MEARRDEERVRRIRSALDGAGLDCGRLRPARERASALRLLARRRPCPGPGHARGADRGHRAGGRARPGRGRLGRRHPHVPAGSPWTRSGGSTRSSASRSGRWSANWISGAVRVGYEGGPASEPARMLVCDSMAPFSRSFLSRVLSPCRLETAEGILKRLRAAKTPREVARIRTACRIAARAFRAGAQQIRAGMLETEAAVHFRAPLSTAGTGFEGVERADGFAWCMSGPNAALAQGAYARSRARPIGRDEMVLVHCNSYADGYWVDVTRTYSLGEPDDRRSAMYEAVFAARAAALAAIRPGARAADVDSGRPRGPRGARLRSAIQALGRPRRRLRRHRPQRPSPSAPEVGRRARAWHGLQCRAGDLFRRRLRPPPLRCARRDRRRRGGPDLVPGHRRRRSSCTKPARQPGPRSNIGTEALC